MYNYCTSCKYVKPQHKRLRFMKTTLVICTVVVGAYWILLNRQFEQVDTRIRSGVPDNKISTSFPRENKMETLNSTTNGDIMYERSFEGKLPILRRKVYAKDAHCKNMTLRIFEEDTFNLTALVSYPGSGNTWIRHLLEITTGVYTGSVYFDEELFSRGFLGEREEWNSGTTIVQKMHLNYNPKFPFSKAIIIVREPFSAIVSFVHYMESGHVGMASPTTFRKKEWPYYILQQVYQWITLVKSWLESGVNTTVVHYESVRVNPSKQLLRMCNFLHDRCPFLDSNCFQNHIEGSFHRKSSFRRLPDPAYPLWVRDKVDDGIDYLNGLLLKHKQEPLPLKLYKHYKIM